MRTLQTDFGPIPIVDDFIPRKEMADYIEAAKTAWLVSWREGKEYDPLSIAKFREMSE